MSDATEPSAGSAEVVAEPAAAAADVAPAEPSEPVVLKKRGRPPGSKDTFKRTRRMPVQVRVEPLEVAGTAAEQPRVGTPRPAPEPPVSHVIAEPQTPRTWLREASRHYMHLKTIVHDTHKVNHAQKYTEKWSTWQSFRSPF